MDTDNGNEKCPNCGSEDIMECHAEATFALPDTSYKVCCSCAHQWDHQ